MTPRDVYFAARNSIKEKYGEAQLLTIHNEKQGIRIINYHRNEMNSGNLLELLSCNSLSHYNDWPFFRSLVNFSVYEPGQVGTKIKNIAIFSYFPLSSLLDGSKHFYIDGTFRQTPKGFYQVVTIMVFDEGNSFFFLIIRFWRLLPCSLRPFA
jgi:hypothetical protein